MLLQKPVYTFFDVMLYALALFKTQIIFAEWLVLIIFCFSLFINNKVIASSPL